MIELDEDAIGFIEIMRWMLEDKNNIAKNLHNNIYYKMTPNNFLASTLSPINGWHISAAELNSLLTHEWKKVTNKKFFVVLPEKIDFIDAIKHITIEHGMVKWNKNQCIYKWSNSNKCLIQLGYDKDNRIQEQTGTKLEDFVGSHNFNIVKIANSFE
jgi:hypothetical protein